MKLFSRFSATVMAGVDKTVSHIENHDAVIEVSLKESQRAAAQARVRLQRVTRDGEALVQRQKILQQKIEHWLVRAKSNHDTDRSLALQCIAKRKQCIADELEIREALKRHAETQKQMVDTINTIEKRVTSMSQQRNQMRSRQSAAEALRVINRIEGNDTNGIDDTFERWDISISETEISAGVSSTYSELDTLEESFIVVEEQQDLEDELDALIAEDSVSDQGGGQ